MKLTTRKIISALIAVVLLMPVETRVSAAADPVKEKAGGSLPTALIQEKNEELPVTVNDTGAKHDNKIVTTVSSGCCGENVYYRIGKNKTEEYVLQIYSPGGGGTITYQYYWENYPWYPYMSSIRHLDITWDSTSIVLPQSCFYFLQQLRSICLPRKAYLSFNTFGDSMDLLEDVYFYGDSDDRTSLDDEASLNDSLWDADWHYYGGCIGHYTSYALRWQLELNGTLTITRNSLVSNAAMENWDSGSDTPWRNLRQQIKKIRFMDGVNDIGSHAFEGCENLETVEIPLSVYYIYEGAFNNCPSLNEVTYFGSEQQWAAVQISSHNLAIQQNGVVHMQKGTAGSMMWQITGEAGNKALSFTPALSGKGKIPDYGPGEAPWYNDRDSIIRVYVYNCNKIGDYAFYGLNKLYDVEIKLTDAIGAHAFEGCTLLPKIDFQLPLKSIGPGAFAGCTSLGKVTSGSGIREVGFDAFRGCMTLYDVSFLRSGAYTALETIGPDAFRNCRLTSVTIPESVTLLGSGAFAGNTKLTSITLPSALTSIPDELLMGDSRLTYVNIPASLTSIGNNAFAGCASYEFLDFSGTALNTIGEYAFANMDQLWRIYLPSSVTSIGNNAFQSCRALQYINLPASLVSLGSSAFLWCETLMYANMPEGLQSIGANAFNGCKNLSRVNLPSTLTSVGMQVFYGCERLDPDETLSIPSGITAIPEGLFDGCSRLSEINIATSVKTIGKNAFRGTALLNVELSGSPLIVDDGAFRNCVSLSELTLPANITRIGTYAFDNTALSDVYFGGSSQQWDQYWNNEIIKDCNYPLYHADLHPASLASGSFTGGTWVLENDGTFRVNGYGSMGSYDNSSPPWTAYKSQIRHLIVGSGITIIGVNCFDGCYALQDVTIPETLTYIGTNAFGAGNGTLTDVYYIGTSAQYDSLLAPNIQSGNGAFNTATKHFTAVASGMAGTNARWILKEDGTLLINGSGPMYSWNSTNIGYNSYKNQIKKVVVQNGITSLCSSAFEGCGQLTTIILPNSITAISNHMLEDCTALTSIVLSQNITSIGQGAFANTGLTGISIPDSVTSVGYAAFLDCEALTSARLSRNLTSLSGRMFRNCRNLTEIVIPEGVTSIGTEAFYWCDLLGEVRLPSTLETIEANAFYDAFVENAYYNGTPAMWEQISIGEGNDHLLYADIHFANGGGQIGSVYWEYTDGALRFYGEGAIPDYTQSTYESAPWFGYHNHIESVTVESGITGIGAYAFHYDYQNLQNAEIADTVETIGDYAFYYCSSLEEFSLSEGLLTIGRGAFDSCSSLAEADLPDSVETIGYEAFFNCSALTRIDLPSSLTSIGENAFINCQAMEGQIVIPEGITVIPAGVFSMCKKITSVTIPAGVTSIGGGAFYSMNALNEIRYDGSPAQWSAISIGTSNEPLDTAFFHYKDASGTFGNGLAWTYTSDGTLEISGNGAMPEYTSSTYNTAPWYGYHNGIRTVRILGGITRIASYSFGHSTSPAYTFLNNLVIADTVTRINTYAFAGSALTNLYLPDSVTALELAVFKDCRSLEQARLSSGLTSLNGSLFQNCTALKEIEVPEGVTLFLTNVFNGCTSLTTVTLPHSLTTVNANSFLNCNALSHVIYLGTQSEWNQVTINATGNAPLLNAQKHFLSGNLEGLEWNLSADGVLTVSGNGAFPSFESESQTPWYLVKDRIREVVIEGGISNVGANAFNQCTYLDKVTLGATVTSIGSYAFANCPNLWTLILPVSVTAAGSYAFLNSPVHDVYYGGTPDDWANISILYGNTELENALIHYPLGDDRYWSLNAGTGLLVFEGSGAIPDYSESSRAPWYPLRSEITAIRIPVGYTAVGKYAFEKCTELASADLPDSLESIGQRAFAGCSSMVELVIPEGVTTLGTNIVNGCTSLQYLSIPSTATNVAQMAFYNAPGLTTAGPYGSGTNLQFGWTTTLPAKAFAGADALVSVILPDTLTSMGTDVFGACTALTSIELPEGITQIPARAFNGCTALEDVTIPLSVTSIAFAAFNNCTSLTDVYYSGYEPNWKAISIAGQNDPLFNAEIHWRQIEGEMGNGQTWLIEGGVLYIYGSGDMPDFDAAAYQPWYEYRDLVTSVWIESGITSIGANAFAGCTGIEEVTIPASVTNISGSAFNECDSLTDVWYGGYEEDWDAISIASGNDPLVNATIHVQEHLLAINEENFPDAGFRTYVRYQLDPNLDGYLSDSERNAVTEIDCEGSDVGSLQGIGYFSHLQELFCGNNELTEIDLSGNPELRVLDCYGNQLTWLDFSMNPALRELICNDNQLQNLDLWGLDQLYYLECQNNQIEYLDLTFCPVLEYVDCSNNLINMVVLDQPKLHLTTLICHTNPFDTLDIVLCPYLVDMAVSDDVIIDDLDTYYHWHLGGVHLQIDKHVCLITDHEGVPVDEVNFPDDAFRAYVAQSIDLNRNGYLNQAEREQVNGIDVDDLHASSLEGIGNFPNIQYLNADFNDLTELDLHENTELRSVSLYDNRITDLDLTGLTKLDFLAVEDNGTLTQIDLSTNTALKSLWLAGNHLTSIDVSGLSLLEQMDVSDNDLSSLDVTGTAMKNLYCIYNDSLTSLNLGNLPSLKTLFCYGTNLSEVNLAGSPILIDAVENGERSETDDYVQYSEGPLRGYLQVDGTTQLVTEETELLVTAMAASLALEGKIIVQFKIIVPDPDQVVATAVITRDNGRLETITVPAVRDTSVQDQYLYRVPMAAKEMGDNINLSFKDLEGNPVRMVTGSGVEKPDGIDYSVNRYLNNKASDSNEKVRNLCRAMKAFGQYSQYLFNYRTDLIENLEELNDVDLETLSAYQSVKTGTVPAGVTVTAASMVLESDTTINFKLAFDDEETVSQYTYTLNGTSVTPVKENGVWMIRKTNIVAKELDVMQELTITDGTDTVTYRYGALTYCYNNLRKATTSETLKNACRAIYWYNQAAHAYFD